MRNRYKLMTEEAGAEAAAGGGNPAAGENNLGTVLNGGEDGKGGDIIAFGGEGYKYAGKYDSPELLEQGYNESVTMHTKKMEEVNDKLKGFVGAPENGEYALPEGANTYSQPVMDSLNKWGAENGLSQDAYDSLLSAVMEGEAANIEAFQTEQMAALGTNAEARIQNANDKWTAMFGADATEWMNSKAMTAEDVEMFESILAHNGSSTVNPEGTQPQGAVKITQEQLSEAMFAENSVGGLKMQSDPEYKKTVDEMTAKFNKQQGKG